MTSLYGTKPLNQDGKSILLIIIFIICLFDRKKICIFETNFNCSNSMNRIDFNNLVIEAIISLLKGWHLAAQTNDKRACISYEYLIGQSIRQYRVDYYMNCHVSKEANSLWNNLTNSSLDIKLYSYQEKITYNGVNPIIVKEFKGNSNSFIVRQLNPNDTFIFNNLFHVEHPVPVSFFKDMLLNLDNTSIQDVDDILKDIHLCWILKEEDKRLPKIVRPNQYQQVIDQVYNPKGIIIT